MIKAGQNMENTYGHLFDASVVNDDLNSAFDDLIR